VFFGGFEVIVMALSEFYRFRRTGEYFEEMMP
jgi:hypothetical protein